jgi:hypothetical protein
MKTKVSELSDSALDWAVAKCENIPERGDTPLIAAMRCYVASKLGEEIDIPEELL